MKKVKITIEAIIDEKDKFYQKQLKHLLDISREIYDYKIKMHTIQNYSNAKTIGSTIFEVGKVFKIKNSEKDKYLLITGVGTKYIQAIPLNSYEYTDLCTVNSYTDLDDCKYVLRILLDKISDYNYYFEFDEDGNLYCLSVDLNQRIYEFDSDRYDKDMDIRIELQDLCRTISKRVMSRIMINIK